METVEIKHSLAKTEEKPTSFLELLFIEVHITVISAQSKALWIYVSVMWITTFIKTFVQTIDPHNLTGIWPHQLGKLVYEPC